MIIIYVYRYTNLPQFTGSKATIWVTYDIIYSSDEPHNEVSYIFKIVTDRTPLQNNTLVLIIQEY